MQSTEIVSVTMDDEGRVTLPAWMRRRCDLHPGDEVLIVRGAGLGSARLHGIGLILLSPVALGRKFGRMEEAMREIDGFGAAEPVFERMTER